MKENEKTAGEMFNGEKRTDEPVDSNNDSMNLENLNMKKEGKKGIISIAIKIVVVVVVLGAALYFLYYKTIYRDVTFIVSKNDIVSAADTESALEYNAGDRIYFYFERKGKVLDANLGVVEIEFYQDNKYQHYKQISYEIEKKFKSLNSYIPGEYFSRAGKYKLKTYLDGNLSSSIEINVIK